ncbi:hypothetical protein D3C72_1713020 [compost metagenome]
MPANDGSSSITSTERWPVLTAGTLSRSSWKVGSGTGLAAGAALGAAAAIFAGACGAAAGAGAASTARSGMTAGNTNVNVLPWPGVLASSMLPPSKAARSREIDSPSPVPP